MKSLELEPKRADAHVNLANVYALTFQDYQKANNHYEKALELTPEDGQLHYNYAAVLDAQSNLERAIEHYQLARKYGIEIAEKNLRNAMARFVAQSAKSTKN